LGEDDRLERILRRFAHREQALGERHDHEEHGDDHADAGDGHQRGDAPDEQVADVVFQDKAHQSVLRSPSTIPRRAPMRAGTPPAMRPTRKAKPKPIPVVFGVMWKKGAMPPRSNLPGVKSTAAPPTPRSAPRKLINRLS